ncbi:MULTISPECIES: bifunctional diguanylate cyclase/phosphodiesterase [unclassified Cryobacterium]|uniref:bifunctional diguanylate cyclase/phosphodiesterase n=1 Tax=unclassified Cryobacterium TaxID=2649013 RepID=UPI002AB5A35C|nr:MULTISPECIES: bifunctional diguanylate cyclase/phosphodiesterase [unclassified Cryobacterium]MDY7542544.1 bifunctional diguanylate cyclase/phosphodiesterase [Cryobacterium sp. 5B3]MEB0267340.1 bifunctional diguanylate cyclase/phosphodiesterase [Cryobacterium sp. 10I5]MEB0275177.1 bifunctional diguanylate cyclase/phosphodiesterase [Cryobacterium sp. 5B3]
MPDGKSVGNRGRASSGTLRRFLRAELTTAFYPGMFESSRAAGTAFGALVFVAGIVVGLYAIQPDQLAAPHGPFFQGVAIVALVLGVVCVLLRRYFTLLVRSIALCVAAGTITFCVAFADAPAAALSFSTSIIFALIVTYVLLPVTHSVYYSLGFAVSISVALSRHDGMLTSDSIVVLASAVAAMLGLHWLVMSALRSETDDLTRLGNRLSFDRLLAKHLREQTPCTGTTVVLIDLDHFSLTNEIRQRSYGDQILVSFADRIARAFPACVGLSRIGGDEFAFLMPDRDATAVLLSLEALRADVHAFSAGIAVRDVGESQSQLTTRASEALSTAKRSGRGTTRVHGGQYASPAAVGLAIANGEFTVVYQPIIDLATMRAAGVEALLRWTHPTRGAISPEEFIPLCETSGAMPRLGDWVLETAMTTAAG